MGLVFFVNVCVCADSVSSLGLFFDCESGVLCQWMCADSMSDLDLLHDDKPDVLYSTFVCVCCFCVRFGPTY